MNVEGRVQSVLAWEVAACSAHVLIATLCAPKVPAGPQETSDGDGKRR